MMWRARVLERRSTGRVVIAIPALYGSAPVGPVQSAVDATAGDLVVVADLTPEAHTADWWVAGFESQIARWYTPAPHTHSPAHIDGLTGMLAAKADRAGVWTKVALDPTWTEPAEGAVQAWNGTTDQSGGAGTTDGIYARVAPDGLQLRIRANTVSATEYSTTLGVLPPALRPGWSATVPGLIEQYTPARWLTTGVTVNAATGAISLRHWDTTTVVNAVSLYAVLALP